MSGLGYVLLGLMLGVASSFAAPKAPSGKDLYRQQCAKCHGRNGEGVKGKYDDALVGDWSIEKLTRVIDRTMPEDAPEKCNGPEAEAVARYIYDTFYSKEARARNKPARVELVRLTNRQYLNSVADLLKGFSGTDPAVNPGGLQASYYNSRRVGRNAAFERIDREINFDYGEGTPDERIPVSTNGFAMQWRGSIIADGTGDYEFILKTPNGSRLWINHTDDDNDPPIIDAAVASGDLTEHRASIRLIGGRAYAVRLEVFKYKEKKASISLQWKPPHGAQQPIPARNLSSQRVSPTLVISTAFPPDDSSVGYERGVSVSKAWDEATTQAAIEVAEYVIKHVNRLTRSEPKSADRSSKIETFCNEFVAAAFRRPLTAEQKALFVSAHFGPNTKPEESLKRVILLTLKSPRFLYLGLNSSKPDAYEVASRLSYGLWDSLPDQELLKAAAEGRLKTHEQVVQQAGRLMNDARTRGKMQYFFEQWLQMNHVEDFSKDAQIYPDFTPEIVADLRASLSIFLEEALWRGTADYRDLLLADYLYLNDRLAKFYGVNAKGTNDFVKVSFDPNQRSGVLTHPYLLAAFSYQKSTSPIHRGVFLTRNIVGRALKSPPMAVAFKDEEFAPNLTMREKIEQLTRSTACQTCHSVINPLGFSLEHYDAVGRFRTREGSKPINAISDYTTDEGDTVTFKTARDLAQFAITSEHAQNGFIEQLFNQVVKQPMQAYGPNTMDHLRKSFVDSGFNIRKLLVDIVTTSALHGIVKPSPAPSPRNT